jgi:multisubunit Na+/H+ antiporter MnhF subunit
MTCAVQASASERRYEMSTISHQPKEGVPAGRRWSLLRATDVWASLAIVVMWLAALLDALFGPEITTRGVAGDGSSVPSAVALALFASVGTWAVAKYGFGRDRRDT